MIMFISMYTLKKRTQIIMMNKSNVVSFSSCVYIKLFEYQCHVLKLNMSLIEDDYFIYMVIGKFFKWECMNLTFSA